MELGQAERDEALAALHPELAEADRNYTLAFDLAIAWSLDVHDLFDSFPDAAARSKQVSDAWEDAMMCNLHFVLSHRSLEAAVANFTDAAAFSAVSWLAHAAFADTLVEARRRAEAERNGMMLARSSIQPAVTAAMEASARGLAARTEAENAALPPRRRLP